jgi:GT2 family glycosyltransferase
MSDAAKPEKLDVVIPCFNPTHDLIIVSRAIDYACELHNLSIKINISDDCSDKMEIYNQLNVQSAEIVVHRNSRNLGECDNVNNAVARLAKEGGRWFILLHADDVACPEWILYCAQYVSQYDGSKPALLHCLNEGVEELPAPRMMKNLQRDVEVLDIPAGRAGIDQISRNWSWIPSGTLIRTDNYLAMGGFHPKMRYAADNDFLVRWLLAGFSIRQVNGIGVYKHLHSGAATSRNVKNGWDTEGWCYLMVQYADQRTMKETLWEHLRWLYRNVRVLERSFRDGDAETVRSRAQGVVVVPLSLLAILWPKMRFLLPTTVQTLLNSVPHSSTP